jgi:hypothetical protein
VKADRATTPTPEAKERVLQVMLWIKVKVNFKEKGKNGQSRHRDTLEAKERVLQFWLC